MSYAALARVHRVGQDDGDVPDEADDALSAEPEPEPEEQEPEPEPEEQEPEPEPEQDYTEAIRRLEERQPAAEPADDGAGDWGPPSGGGGGGPPAGDWGPPSGGGGGGPPPDAGDWGPPPSPPPDTGSPPPPGGGPEPDAEVPADRAGLTAATKAANDAASAADRARADLFRLGADDASLDQADALITATADAGTFAKDLGDKAKSNPSTLIKQLGKLTYTAGQKALDASRNLSDSLISAMEAIAINAAKDAEGYIKKLTEGGIVGPAPEEDTEGMISGLPGGAFQAGPANRAALLAAGRAGKAVGPAGSDLKKITKTVLPVSRKATGPAGPDITKTTKQISTAEAQKAAKTAGVAATAGRLAMKVGRRATVRQQTAGKRAIAAGQRAVNASRKLSAPQFAFKPGKFKFKVSGEAEDGYVIMGALRYESLARIRSRSSSPAVARRSSKPDVVQGPRTVTLMWPKANPAAFTYADPTYPGAVSKNSQRIAIDRVAVWGGEFHTFGVGQPREYTRPERVWILFQDRTSRMVTGLEEVMITGGTLIANRSFFGVAVEDAIKKAYYAISVNNATHVLERAYSVFQEAQAVATGGVFGRNLGVTQTIANQMIAVNALAQKLRGERDQARAVTRDEWEKVRNFVRASMSQWSAVNEGREYQGRVFDQFLDEVKQAAADLPGKIAEAPRRALESITGIPIWAWWAGGIGLVGLVGLGAAKAYLR